MPLQIDANKAGAPADNNNNVNNPSTEEHKSMAQENKEEMERIYTDERTIIISPVRNYSNYRNVNALALGTPKMVIGSSVNSSRILSSNKEEVEKYMPAIIGLNPNHQDFTSRVKAWFNNIRVIVNENTKLDVTFTYDHYKDYVLLKAKEDDINSEYDNADKSNTEKLENALKRKITRLNDLESSRCRYGSPRNIEQYLIYRHCLNYKDVAKDIALINTDPSIRFYIKDEEKEREREEKLIKARQTAMRNYVEILGDDEKFNSLYIQLCVNQNYNVTEYSLKTKSEKEKIMMDYLNERPVKFNNICGDKHLRTKALVEVLIARGELTRTEHNQNIYTSDGEFIAANIKDAVIYFNNPENKDIRTSYENKIKMF